MLSQCLCGGLIALNTYKIYFFDHFEELKNFELINFGYKPPLNLIQWSIISGGFKPSLILIFNFELERSDLTIPTISFAQFFVSA